MRKQMTLLLTGLMASTTVWLAAAYAQNETSDEAESRGPQGAVVRNRGAVGSPNLVLAEYGTVGGGLGNTVHDILSTIGGGRDNDAKDWNATIAGGYSNIAAGAHSTISGGFGNEVQKDGTTIGGGVGNRSVGENATVGGGRNNSSQGNSATVGGGINNRVAGDFSTIAGGYLNTAAGANATVGGGTLNNAEGNYSTVPGGAESHAKGDYSFAAGRRAKADHAGAFVWSDAADGEFRSTGPDQFLIRASGNVGIGTNAPREKLTVSGNVSADNFIGSGAGLTDIPASAIVGGTPAAAPSAAPGPITTLDIADGSILPDDLDLNALDQRYLRADAAPAAAAEPITVDGEVLTKDTMFVGDVVGTYDRLRIVSMPQPAAAELMPQDVKAIHLANDSVSDQHVKKHSLSPQKIAGTALTAKTRFGGDVSGTFDDLRISNLKGVKAEIDRGDVTGDKLANGAITDAKISDDAKIDPRKIEGEALTADTLFGGDISGTFNDLRIRRVDNLATRVQNMDDKFISRKGGTVTGSLNIEGTIRADSFSGRASNLTDIPAGELRGEIKPNIVDGVALTEKTRFNGDVVGSFDNLRIKNIKDLTATVDDDSITSDKIRDGAVSTRDVALDEFDARYIGREDLVDPDQVNGGALTEQSRFNGDVFGTFDNLRISQDLLDKLATRVPEREVQAPEKSLWHVSSRGALELIHDGERLGRIHPTLSSPNTQFGHEMNTVKPGANGVTISGGGRAERPNKATASFATIAGGTGNRAGGSFAAIGGGGVNSAMGGSSVVGGGAFNRADGKLSAIGGGHTNTTRGSYSAIAGGMNNLAVGSKSAIPGGMNNIANGNYSLAAGRNAKALHDGAFVWGDSSSADISSTGPDQFIVRATGGVQFRTAPDRPVGVRIQAGSGSWSSLSDKASKSDFESVDPHAVLHAVANMPIATWRYKAQDVEVRHMGPIAQDFHAAFELGEDERHISSVDADGVALAAIQGLYDIVSALQAENETLKQRIDELEAK